MNNADNPRPHWGERLQRPRRAVAVWLALLLLAVLAVLAAQAIPAFHPASTSAAESSAARAMPVPAAAGEAPEPMVPETQAAPVAETMLPAAPPRRLVIKDADVDVPIVPLELGAADLAAQSIVPPETTDGYWFTNYGQPGLGSTNTTYIAGHSWAGRDSAFNRLSTRVGVGEAIELVTDSGTMRYIVESVTTHDKDTLKDSDIWLIVPNRLVLISCFTEDLWGKNVVVTATPARE